MQPPFCLACALHIGSARVIFQIPMIKISRDVKRDDINFLSQDDGDNNFVKQCKDRSMWAIWNSKLISEINEILKKFYLSLLLLLILNFNIINQYIQRLYLYFIKRTDVRPIGTSAGS